LTNFSATFANIKKPHYWTGLDRESAAADLANS